MTAFDLAYLIGLALIRSVPNEGTRGELFELLTEAYGGEKKRELGKLPEILTGLQGFSKSAAAAAVALGGTAGAAPVVAFAGQAFSSAVRLLPSRGVILESSPTGRLLLDALSRVIAALGGDQPFVLIDGLEKMNGEAPDRFRSVFLDTQLVLQVPIGLVIAAPPSTLTSVHSAGISGYETHPVFVDPDPDFLDRLLKRRGVTEKFMVADLRSKIAEAAGGVPRHAVQIAREAVTQGLLRAVAEQLDEVQVERPDVDRAVAKIREELNRGLDEDAYRVLARIREDSPLPSDEIVPGLFASGRILAIAPREDGRTRFRAHPLLDAALEALSR
ncbi:MAG: hypothetical protein HYV07_22665 [Deltaproteobacteria bacterium]|nr:hypothetical protein [Deltaproteobacteria bacterium]